MPLRPDLDRLASKASGWRSGEGSTGITIDDYQDLGKDDAGDEWPCFCGGDRPAWGFHAENACGDRMKHASMAVSGSDLGERFPNLGRAE